MQDRSIRASATNNWADCERRLVATAFPDLVMARGIELERRPTHIGAHVGTAAHASVASMWREVAASGGDWPSYVMAFEVGVASLENTFAADGVVYDDTTKDRQEAIIATDKIVKAYRNHRSPAVVPLAFETLLEARIKRGWKLTGHVDLMSTDAVFVADTELDDLKTGVSVPSPGPQLGSYDMLLEAVRTPVKSVRMTFIRRVRRTAEQPPPLIVPMDRAIIRRQARFAIEEITTKVDALAKGADIFTAKANTNSRLCSAKFCSAFGTDWCPESRSKFIG